MIRIIDYEGNGYGAQAEVTRTKGVNGEKSLTGTIYTNDEVLNGVDRGWRLQFEEEFYVFTFALPNDTGDQIELEFDAVHEFFYDMSKSAQNDLLSDGSHTFKSYLDFIFSDSDYSYVLDVSVSAFEKQSFGQKNRLDLFYDVIETAGVEFTVNGSVVRILERVGNDLSTVVKKGFNLNELKLEKNIGDFVTYQKGFGAWDDEDDHSKGRLEVEYLSPLAETYGKLDADPVVDERYTNKNSLENRLKSNVEGSYQISVQIDMEDLTRAGYEYKQPHEGDSIMAINDDLGFQRKVRIVSYETDFDVEGNVLDHRITCNSIGMVDKSIMGNASLKSAVKQLETDVELTRKQVTEALVSSDGKSMNYYGPVEPTEEDYKLRIGDTWFDSSGEDTIIKVWNGVEWRKSGADVEAMKRQFEELELDIEEAKQTADEAVEQIDTAVANAGFTNLDETISSVQTISSQAQINSGTAINNALEAMQQASQAVDNTGSLNVRVDDVENTLSVKADKQTVADLTGVVDTQALDIKANADGLKLKANQDTVDLIDGRVSSLGTEFNAVAGQVNSRVWNTDIETAIDGIEVGGRNYLLGSDFKNGLGDFGMYRIPLSTTNGNYIEGTKSLIATRTNSPNDGRQLNMGMLLNYSGTISDEYYTFSFYSKGFEDHADISVFFERPRVLNWEVSSVELSGDWKRYRIIFTALDSSGTLYLRPNGNRDYNFEILLNAPKLEKGNKATDWTPAPEDTDAKINHIETEWTQTFDSFSQTVAGIDGRVTSQKQTIDSITQTVTDQTGKIATVEQNLNGIQQTVSDPVNGLVTQVSTLASGFNVLASEQVDNLIPKDRNLTNGYSVWNRESSITINRIINNRTEIYVGVSGQRIWYPLTLEQGKKYKITFEARTHVSGREISVGRGSKNLQRIAITDVATSYEAIFESDGSTHFSIFFHSTGTYEIGNLKVEETTAVSNAQLSVLNDNINARVEKGDVINQINISDESILIQANKIMALGDVVVDGKLTITDEFIAPNAQIDGAKIADATIGSAKIANLDVDKISGNKAQLVEAGFNGINSFTHIDSEGIHMLGSGAYRRTYVTPTGFDLYNGSGGDNKAGAIGYFKESGHDASSNENYINSTRGTKHYIGLAANSSHHIILGYDDGKSINGFDRALQVDGDTGVIRFFKPITTGSSENFSLALHAGSHRGSSVIGWRDGGAGRGRIFLGENTTYLESGNSTEFYAQSGRHLMTLRDAIIARENIFMDGNQITGTSDARLKTNVTDTHINSLGEIKSWNFVDFEWIDDKQKGVQFGLLAQETSLVSEYDKENDLWSINMSKQVMVNSHAIQQVAFMEENTNKIASQALQATETNAQKIERLEKEIQKLKEAA